MILYKAIGAALVAATVYTLLKPSSAKGRFAGDVSKLKGFISAGQQDPAKKRDRERRRREIMGKGDTIIRRFIRNVEAITTLTGTPLSSYYRNASVAAVVGVVIGLLVKNPLLSLMLAPVFWLLPFAKLALEVQKHKKLINEQLIDVLGSINSRFMAEPNFVLAVKKCLPTMPAEALPHFKHFVEKVDLNMEVVQALEELDIEIENDFFHEWIRLAIQAAKGETGLRYTMMGIPQDMTDHKSQYDSFEIEIYEYRRDFAISVAALPGTVVLMYFAMNTFYGYLVDGLVGKIYLALCVPAELALWYLYHRYSKRPDVS